MQRGSTRHFGVVHGKAGGPANIDLHQTVGHLQLFQRKHKLVVTPAMAVELIVLLGQFVADPVLRPKDGEPN